MQGTCSCNTQTNHRLKKDNVFDNKLSLNFQQPSTRPILKIMQKPPDNKSSDLTKDTSSLDHKHVPTNKGTQSINSNPVNIKTSGAISREQQDRKKRFKQRTLPDFFK